jgi:hypothetical protein
MCPRFSVIIMAMRSAGRNFGPAAWAALFVAALVSSVLLNKPLLKMVLNLRPLGVAVAIAASFCGLGGPLARRLRPGVGWSDELIASFGLGIGLTGLAVFVLGLCGVTNAALYALWTIAGLALFGLGLLKRKTLPAIAVGLSNPLNVLGLVLLVVFFVELLPPLAAPEVSTDALEYHLLVPKIYLSQGRIGPISGLIESNYPSLIQYIYLFILPWAGDAACKAFHFLGGMFLLLAVGRLARRLRPQASLLAPALLFSMPVANIVFGWAWNDAFFAFFTVGSLLFLLEPDFGEREGVRGKGAVAAGIAAGLAIWTKYTFLMTVPALLAVVVWDAARRRRRWRDVVGFLAPAAAAAFFVFAKNWLWTGNPIYPFLNSVFRSPELNGAAASYFVTHGLQRLEIPDWNWTTYFLFPFRLTLAPKFVDLQTGVVPLLFTPLLFLRRVRREMSRLGIFLAASALLWLFVFQTGTRSLLPVLAILLVAGTVVLEDLLEGRRAFRAAAVALFSLAGLANLGLAIVTNYYLTRPVPYFVGKEDRASFLLREAESQPVYDWLNRAPGVGTVLLVGLHKPYYLNRPFVFSGIGDIPAVERLVDGAKDARAIQETLLKLGITHLALDRDQYDRENGQGLFSWPSERRAAFEEFLSSLCFEAASFGRQRIYGLR